MNSREMSDYVREEIRQINLFREELSQETEAEISRNEASLLWIDTKAEQFRRAWLMRSVVNNQSAMLAG